MSRIAGPTAESLAILSRAREYIDSVPYKVGLRWTFYRLFQDGTLPGKDDYKGKLMRLASLARKEWNLWPPDLLEDGTRELALVGGGWGTADGWLASLRDGGFVCQLDKWESQPYYIMCAFEARAMQAQFHHYLPMVNLCPCGGDASIPHVYSVARTLVNRANKNGKPVLLYYCGDADKKGEQIAASFVERVRRWCRVPFEFHHIGLTLDQAKGYGLPENPDRPGQYQWESLLDEQAAEILATVSESIDVAAWEAVEEQEREAERKVIEVLSGLDLADE